MEDEHKTKEQLIQELMDMRQRIAESEAPETQRRRLAQGIPERRIWLPVAGMFLLLCALVWLNEIVDLPRLLLGAPHTPINWREAITEMVLIAGVGLFAVSRLIRDVAELKHAEETLEAALAFQQSIIDGLAEPIMVVGTDYRVKLMNRTAREFLPGSAGASESPLCHQVIRQRDTPCEGMEQPCPLGQVRESGQPVTVVHEHHRANGERRFVEVIASPLWGEDGTFEGVIESMRDITEPKRAEQALQQHTERLRALGAQLADVTEAERQRLSRELHDQVGQNLTALGINLNIVRSQIPDEAAAPVRSRLDDSLSLVEQTSERIRNVMAELRPPVLDDYGLVAALHWYGQQFGRRTDIAMAVQGEEPVPRLAARVENALFRIAQEALTNVAKHAQATQVTVTVEVDGGTFCLVVADDGIGFDPAHPTEPDGGWGWGLLSMTERAEAVGGRCRVESSPGRGTRVIVEVER